MTQLQKSLDQITAGRHNILSVFDDFLQMSICAFSFGKMEDEYEQIAKRYDPNEVKLFGQCLGAMIIDYEENSNEEGSWCDVLGEYFETNNSDKQASRSGQFFTPDSICRLMAEMTDSANDEVGIKSINDCACGSGRNLIAHARQRPMNIYSSYYIGQDLDYRCVKMCVLNMVMYGMTGMVIHMNTLSLKVYRGYRIALTGKGSVITPMDKEECERYVSGSIAKEPEQSIVIAPKIIKQPLQATLF